MQLRGFPCALLSGDPFRAPASSVPLTNRGGLFSARSYSVSTLLKRVRTPVVLRSVVPRGPVFALEMLHFDENFCLAVLEKET